MSDDDLYPPPPYKEPEPRFRIQGDTWEELLDQLKAIIPEPDKIELLSGKAERPRPVEEIETPERVSHRDLHEVADELTQRLQDTPPRPEGDEEPPSLDQTNWLPHRRSERGDVLRRLERRRARQMETEPGYIWLYDAMMARELDDRNYAVQQLERVGDAARLERLSEHSLHRVTRRAALDALARLGAVPALESAALYVRAEVFIPKKPKPTGEEPASTLTKNAPEFHDDTRDHAVDLLAELADNGREDALEALLRIVRYDFSRDTAARLRALRRLGERIDKLEERRDWNALSLLYRESRNASVRRKVTSRLAQHLEELEEAEAVDALLAVADMHPDQRYDAEAAARRIERS